ncbi:MAG TPA: hypothetical protein VF273_10700 [Pelobium sp.]
MKSEQTIYFKWDGHLLPKNLLVAILILTGLIAAVAITMNYQQNISELATYLILSICLVTLASSSYCLSKEATHNYIYLNNSEISFKQNKADEVVIIKFEALDYFETRFSEIVFNTKQQEKISLPLNKITDKHKRWEIKEFLRERLKQINGNAVAA